MYQIYQIYNEETVILHLSEKSKVFLPVDDEEYQKWLLAGNSPLSKNEKIHFPTQEERLEALELAMLEMILGGAE